MPPMTRLSSIFASGGAPVSARGTSLFRGRGCEPRYQMPNCEELSPAQSRNLAPDLSYTARERLALVSHSLLPS